MAETPSTSTHRPAVTVSISGQRAMLRFSGALGPGALRQLEERLLDPRLHEADVWVLEMEDLTMLDLACAYALLSAATRSPQTAELIIRGARRTVRRTLRDAGVNRIAAIEE